MKKNTFICVKSVWHSSASFTLVQILSFLILFLRVFVVAFSLAAVFNLFCKVTPAAACARPTISRVTHAVTVLPHGVVLAVYWCRRLKRWRRTKSVTSLGIKIHRE